MSMDPTGKIRLATLYEKTSTRGNRYFVGRLGAARIMLFEDKFADGDDPAWHLCLQESPGARAGPGQHHQPLDDSQTPQDAQLKLKTARTPRKRRRASVSASESLQAPLGADPKDPLPDHLLE